MLVYSQSSGALFDFANMKTVLANGYSGKGADKNNPKSQEKRALGPIPRGFWRIGDGYASANTGPQTIPLYKLDGNPGDDVDNITGRSAFRIHGDSASRPGDASQGCIILPRSIRDMIAASRHEILWVQE